MNKTAIKNFAIWARKKLIADITYKAGLLGITDKGIQNPLPQSLNGVQFFDIGTKEPYKITNEEIKQRTTLVEVINNKAADSDYKTAYNSVVEEVAYTWFNRLIAIRFMEVNDYLPSKVRVLSSESAAKKEPDLVTKPFDAEFKLTQSEKDNITKLTQDNQVDELFRMLFIKQCNVLNQILPNLFEETSNYTEILLNVSFTDQEGIIYHLVNDIDEDDFNVEKEGQVEIIGWLYQYYNTEPKDEAFALLKKNVKITKERIPAATQLFTPDWIVRYMVENSLGRLWVEGHPNDELKSTWKYYLEEAEQDEEVKIQLEKIREEYKSLKPEDIKVIDPCMGSGHILVYAFDVLIQIYESAGYSQRDAAKSILENNIYGLDIDNRAYQLSYFALMMKARFYNRRILDGNQICHVYSIQESNGINRLQLDFFGSNSSDFERNSAKIQVQKLIETFTDAKEYGSILNVEPMNWELLSRFAADVNFGSQMSLEAIGIEETQIRLSEIIKIAEVMARKYDVVVTNPPYMGKKSLNSRMSDFIEHNYSIGKSELYSAFMLKCLDLSNKNKFVAMITIHTWMFISSFKEMRDKILSSTTINTMVHTGAATFEELNSFNVLATSFCLRKGNQKNYQSKFIRLAKYYNSDEKIMNLHNTDNMYSFCQEEFFRIPGNPLVYWISENVKNNFEYAKPLRFYAEPKQGMATADNEIFVRYWYEIDYMKTMLNAKSHDEANECNCKWFPYNKGGDFRKWYGMNEYVVNWERGGRDLKNFKSAVLRNQTYYFKSGITWSLFGFENFAVRYKDSGFIFDVSGSSLFPPSDLELYMLAFLTSKVAFMYLSLLAPTVNFQVGNIGDLPLIISSEIKPEIDILAQKCIDLSIADWDDFEESWCFSKHPLLNCEEYKSLSLIFNEWSVQTNSRYEKLKANEEQINKLFIDVYNIDNVLEPHVVDRDIAIRKADLPRDIKSLVSYAVGCMFGRYSIDAEGLVYAGGEWDDSKYLKFIPDRDNCIPITDEEYFKDDIMSRFVEFVKAVYGTETLEENLDFIANSLDNKGNSSREVIRNYFLKDFYKDHIKAYQKRPIYWLYDSGKQDGFKALIYMHRYSADTNGIVRVDYLHTLQKKYAIEIENMKDFAEKTDNAREAANAQKRIEKLKKQLNETESYDEKLGHLALSRIAIDLDDGVKVNYEKVQTDAEGHKYEILAKI